MPQTSTTQESSLFFEIGGTFSNFISPLLNWITQENVGPAIAVTILTTAFLISIYMLIRYGHDLYLINQAIKTIQPFQNEQSFSENYNKIDQDLTSIKKLNNAWDEFTETLLLPRSNQDGSIIVCANTERPHDFFTLDQLHMGPGFTKSLPNIFIGIGLSLTFLGLIAALSQAVSAIDKVGEEDQKNKIEIIQEASKNADTIIPINHVYVEKTKKTETEEIQEAITKLLVASSAKFYASLFALFSSIILTIQIKWTTATLNSQLNKFSILIERGVKFQTLESLSLEANEILNNQLGQLQTFNTDLAMKIGDQLRETFQPLVAKIEGIGGDLTESNLENMKNISQGIAEGIQGATKDSMAGVAEKLDSVSDKLEGLGTILSSSLDNFDSEFKVVLEQLKNSLQESTENVAADIGSAFDGMKSNIEGTKDDVGNILLGLKSTMEELSSKGKDIANTSTAQLKSSMSAASEQASKGIADAGKVISDELKGSAEGLSASITDAAIIAKQQISEAGKDIADGFSNSTTNLVSSLDKITTKLVVLEKSLASLPEQFITVTNTLEPITSSMKQASVDIKSASAQFETAGSSLESTIEPLTQYVTDSKIAIESISTSLQLTTDHMGQATSSIEESVRTLKEEISSQVKELSGSDEKLASLHKALTESTESVLTKLNLFTTQVDNNFSASIGTLENAIEEFSEVIDDFTKEKNKRVA